MKNVKRFILCLGVPLFLACSDTEPRPFTPKTDTTEAHIPPGWPLRIGDVVASTLDLHLEFPDLHQRLETGDYGSPIHGVPRYEPIPVKIGPDEYDTRGEKYACAPEPLPSTPYGHQDFWRKVGGRPWIVLELPGDIPCDPEAVYDLHWMYIGHVR